MGAAKRLEEEEPPAKEAGGGRQGGRCAWQRQQPGQAEGREYHCVLKVRM